MELAFGFFGFFLTQLALTGLFSLTVYPSLAFVVLVLGLTTIGLAFSEWSYRKTFPFAAAILLAVVGTANLPLHGGWWWSLGNYVFAAASLALGAKTTSLTWRDVAHPGHLFRTRASRHS